VRDTLGKNHPWAVGIVAEEFANMGQDVDGSPCPRQISNGSIVVTMDRLGRLATERAGGLLLRRGQFKVNRLVTGSDTIQVEIG
jgi:hypothetical protein